MCWYHVTFDLDLDLEHTLDGRSPGDHRVQVWWRSGHLSGTRSDLRKSLQTDGQTDRRRTPRHCISSLEWAKNWSELYHLTLNLLLHPEKIEWSTTELRCSKCQGGWGVEPPSAHITSLSMNGLLPIITRPPSTTMHCIPCVRSFGHFLVIKIHFSAKQSTKLCLFKI